MVRPFLLLLLLRSEAVEVKSLDTAKAVEDIYEMTTDEGSGEAELSVDPDIEAPFTPE
jgi:hypothetical protein